MRWESWTHQPVLAPGTAHVLAWPVARSGPESTAGTLVHESRGLLDREEQERADRFVYARHRQAYVQAHTRMRQILAGYLQVPAEAVGYGRDRRGKPRLLDEAAGLHYNLSHTDGWCALAICRGAAEAGIDVERVRTMEQQVAESHFSAREREQLRTLREDAWQAAFFRCWTRKEAVLKGEGLGLRAPLDAFDVSLLPGEEARLVEARPESGFRHSWTLSHFEPAAGVIGAVALSAPLQTAFYRLE